MGKFYCVVEKRRPALQSVSISPRDRKINNVTGQGEIKALSFREEESRGRVDDFRSGAGEFTRAKKRERDRYTRILSILEPQEPKVSSSLATILIVYALLPCAREEKIKLGSHSLPLSFSLSLSVSRAEARIELFFSRRGSTADKTVPWPRLAKTFRDLIASQKSHRTAKKIHLAQWRGVEEKEGNDSIFLESSTSSSLPLPPPFLLSSRPLLSDASSSS